MDVHGVGMLDGVTWRRYGDRVLGQVHEWRNLGHRQRDILQLGKWLMWNVADIREYFESVRAFWDSRAQDGKAPDSVKLLVAQFDPSNYIVQPAGEGEGSIAEFQIPDALRETTSAASNSARVDLLIFGFPTECRRLLEGDTTLAADKVESLWQELQELASIRCEYKGHPYAAHVAAGITGAIAVLFVLFRNYLRANPDREEWCLRQLRDTLAEAPRREFDDPGGDMSLDWEGFVAQCAAVLLSERPTDPSVRELAGVCVTAFHPNTTGLFFRQMYQLRSAIGRDFTVLCNLALFWAGLRWTSASITWEISTQSVERWRGRLVTRYVNRRLVEDPLDWSGISDRIRRLCYSFSRAFIKVPLPPWLARQSTPSDGASITVERRRLLLRRTAPGLDLEVIQNAFAFASRIDDAQSELERSQWIGYLRQALELSLATVPLNGDDENTRDCIPGQFDRWILLQIASVCPRLEPSERSEDLWHPIFDLGSKGHYWVKHSLQCWFLEGVAAASTPQRFFQEWKKMLTYAEQLGWTPEAKIAFHLEEALTELLGWGVGARTLGNAEFRDVITQMQPVYESWGRAWIRDGGLAPAFARFLLRPSASRLLPIGLKWLDEARREFSEHEWTRGHLEDAVVDLLRHCWSGCQAQLRQDGEFRAAFDGLLNSLVNLNNVSALELRDLINRAPTRPLVAPDATNTGGLR